jgi:hypothetical protein
MMQMPNLRKHRIAPEGENSLSLTGEIDILSIATISFTSELSEHPVEHIFDGRAGRGATRWVGFECGKPERVELTFDTPQAISTIVFGAEELQHERRQEVRIEISTDSGRKYRQILMQQFNFSPWGATYQHEELQVELFNVTNLRLIVQGGAHRQSLTTLRLFK